MNHKLKRKWVNALRGGTYKQCIHIRLMKDGSRCALGVLSAVAGIDYLMGDQWLIALWKIFDKSAEIADMNDAGKSFPELADWIEENL